MARSDEKRVESSDDSPVFSLNQLVDALRVIIAQQELQRQQAHASGEPASLSPSSSTATTRDTHRVHHSSGSSASAGQSSQVPATANPPPVQPSTSSHCHYSASGGHASASANPIPAAPVPAILVALAPAAAATPAPLPSNVAPTLAATVAPAAAAAPVGPVPAPAAPVAHAAPLYGGYFSPPASDRWYIVVRGRAVGVFLGWHNVGPLISGVGGAVFQRFPSQATAQVAFNAALAAGNVAVIE